MSHELTKTGVVTSMIVRYTTARTVGRMPVRVVFFAEEEPSMSKMGMVKWYVLG